MSVSILAPRLHRTADTAASLSYLLQGRALQCVTKSSKGYSAAKSSTGTGTVQLRVVSAVNAVQ